MLRPLPIPPIPLEPARVARAAFPKGHRDLRVADELATLFTDDTLVALFPTQGQPAQPLWRLALVTILPCAAGLSDRQAAHAVRSRIAWKYVLRLELTDAGFDASVLSEVRRRLLAGAAEFLLFDLWRTWCRNHQLVKARGRQRTDSSHLLATVRALNRIEVMGETLRHALNTRAVVAPEWWRAVSQPDWQNRYTQRAEDDRLPTIQTAPAALTLTIGHDGGRWRSAVDHPDAPPWLREIPAVAIRAGSGAKPTGGRERSCAGARRTIFRRPHSASARPMMRKPTMPAGTPPRGWATKSISRKPVTMTSRT
jgi:transposase